MSLSVYESPGCPHPDCNGDGTVNDHDGVAHCIDCGRMVEHRNAQRLAHALAVVLDSRGRSGGLTVTEE